MKISVYDLGGLVFPGDFTLFKSLEISFETSFNKPENSSHKRVHIALIFFDLSALKV
jgi:hypothetical protein